MYKLISTTVIVLAAAYLCLRFCHQAALSEEPLQKHVILSLRIADQYIGSDCPVFALYDDKTAIFRSIKEPFEYNENLYRSIKLSPAEEESILNLVSGLAEVRDRYSIKKATDQPWNIFLINTPTLNKSISVYGNLLAGCPSRISVREETPLPLVHLFDRLSNFENKNAEPWLPEFIEVQLRSWDNSIKSPLHWPINWPDLTDSRTKQRSEDSYSIYLPSANLHQLILLLKQDRPIKLDNKKWGIIYRFPFPDEQPIRNTHPPIEKPTGLFRRF